MNVAGMVARRLFRGFQSLAEARLRIDVLFFVEMGIGGREDSWGMDHGRCWVLKVLEIIFCDQTSTLILTLSRQFLTSL